MYMYTHFPQLHHRTNIISHYRSVLKRVVRLKIPCSVNEMVSFFYNFYFIISSINIQTPHRHKCTVIIYFFKFTILLEGNNFSAHTFYYI